MPDKTKIETELDLLAALEPGGVVTQQALSKRLSVSVGLVNALLKRVVGKGLAKAKAAPYKRWAYYLTPQGFAQKSRLVAEYLERSLVFYRMAKEEYGQLFVRIHSRGIGSVVLVGRGELAEIALLAAREEGVDVVGFLDREANLPNLHGIPRLGHPDEAGPGAVLVVTDSRRPQEAFDWVRHEYPRLEVQAPAFLRIARMTRQAQDA